MNTKVLLATIATAVVAFFLGWLIFGVLLMDFYKSNTITYDGLEKLPPDFLAMFLSNVAMAFLLVFIFTKWGIKTAADGAQGGLIVFGLIALSIDLFFYSTLNLFSPVLLVVDVTVNAFYGALLGVVAAVILGYSRKVASV